MNVYHRASTTPDSLKGISSITLFIVDIVIECIKLGMECQWGIVVTSTRFIRLTSKVGGFGMKYILSILLGGVFARLRALSDKRFQAKLGNHLSHDYKP